MFGSVAAADGTWLFESNPIVAGFLVDDIQAARDELARTPNVELLGELRVLPDGYAWQHFRAPDGHVYELTADPSAATTGRAPPGFRGGPAGPVGRNRRLPRQRRKDQRGVGSRRPDGNPARSRRVQGAVDYLTEAREISGAAAASASNRPTQ